MRRKSLGKGLRALIPTKRVEPEPEEPEKHPEIQGLDEPVLPEGEDNALPPPEIGEPESPEPFTKDSFEKPLEINEYSDNEDTPVKDPRPEPAESYPVPRPVPSYEDNEPIERERAPEEEPEEHGQVTSPDTSKMDDIPEEVMKQLKEIREFDFDQRRIATYQKALERAWFDEKITADEQFILDGLREVLEISNEEHKIVESEILRALEKRYSEGLDQETPLGKIENEHERRKREIYQYFQRGSEYYETDKYFEAIIEWEKILEIEPGNPLIMKAINNARRYLESPALEEIGAEPVYSYKHPMKEEALDKRLKKQTGFEEASVNGSQMGTPTMSEKASWISEQNKMKSELMAIKDEEDKERKKASKLFKLAYKNYKAGKYVRAIKLWKRVIKLNPEHTKARKGMKLALKKYKLMKKKRAEKLEKIKDVGLVKVRKKPKTGAEASEMEIPELVEAEPKLKVEIPVEAGTGEMEIPEIEEKIKEEPEEPLIIEDEIAGKADELLIGELDSPAPGLEPDEPSFPEPEPLTAESELQPETIEVRDEEVTVVEDEEPPVLEPAPVLETQVEPEFKTVDGETVDLTFERPKTAEEPTFIRDDLSSPEVTEIIEEPPIEAPEKTTEDLIKEYYVDAVNLVKAGRFSGALEMMDEIVRLEPENHEAWNDKGILLDSLGKHTSALECFEKALEFQPSYSDALLNKGIALSSLNQPAEALDIFNEILSQDSTSEEAWMNKGFTQFSLKQFEQAIDSLNKGLGFDPGNEEALLKLGESYQKLEQFSNASKTYEKLLSINPGQIDAKERLSECQQNLKWELLKAWNI